MTVKAIPVKTKCEGKNLSPVPDKHNEMKRLEFTADLLTDIAEIDNQHRKLYNIGNSVLFTGRLRLDPNLH